MEIIVVSRSSMRRAHLGAGPCAVLLVFVGSVFVGSLFGAFRLGVSVTLPEDGVPPAAVERELERQRREVADAVRRSEEDLNALALRLGRLQANVIRLDALGGRLARNAGLDPGEFDFGRPPPLGGPANASALAPQDLSDFIAALRELELRLEDREPKLKAIENIQMLRRLHGEVYPAGRPVKDGWISSPFGWRNDPITGKRSFHEGVDFSAQKGADVVAVAAGVVVFSGAREGYGRMVEINHGGGYATRYAHNRKNLVSFGEVVKKGQVIAIMGSTGRTTGRHVHLEVLDQGKPVDPAPFVAAAE